MNSTDELTYTSAQLHDKIVESSRDIKFACIINDSGNVLCTFNENYLNMNDAKKKMFFMEAALQTKMNKDFDNELGEFKYTVTERKDGDKCVSAPLSSNEMIFVLMNKDEDHNSFVKDTINTSYLSGKSSLLNNQ